MTTTMRDLKVYRSLTVVRIDGFPPEDAPETGLIDMPGSANWLCCDGYGMAADASSADTEHPGILYTDYDSAADEPRTFSVLIDADEVEALTAFAREAGYTVLSAEPVAEPTNFGDGGGTCEILRHRDGWVVVEN